jgi:coniferyl-aldehyde dehydrogenase
MVAQPTALADQQQLDRLQRVYRQQRAAFGSAPNPGLAERRAHLKQLKAVLLSNRERLAHAVHEDFGGRSHAETMGELLSVVHAINYTLKRLKRWMKPSRRATSLLMATTKSTVYYQPLGVVGIIVPWNYPLALSFGPLVFALAAGNRVMIKMSESTPHTGELTRELLEQTFGEDHVAVILGAIEAGKAFTSLPFDHLLFTGATNVGREIMRQAADNLTPVTLELGGKSPTLIAEDMPMDMAAERICFGKSLNAGQTCVAPDYVLCPRDRVDEFVSAFAKHYAAMYPDVHSNEDYTCIVNDRHYARLEEWLDDARARGAEVIELNPGDGARQPGSRKMPLKLLKNVTAEMRVMQEEIFGPLLPIVPYDHLDQAIDFINHRPRPLALNLFDLNSTRREHVLAHTHTGGVCINDAVSHFIAEDLPFGGVGESGMGHYHGYEGFLTFSHIKSVFSRPRINTARSLYAPHGGLMQKLLYKIFLR